MNISRHLIKQRVSLFQRRISFTCICNNYENKVQLSSLNHDVWGVNSQTSFTNISESKLDVLFEDDSFCFVNKPHKIATTGVQGSDMDFHHFVKAYFSSKSLLHRPALLHRLDLITSGVMIFAKNKLNEKFFQTKILQKTLPENKLQRDYLVLVDGEPPYKKASVNRGIVKDEKFLKRWKLVKNGGKPCKSTYRVLATSTNSKGDKVSAVSIRIFQGYTHQVRATCRYLRCPVIGDQLYHLKKTTKANSETTDNNSTADDEEQEEIASQSPARSRTETYIHAHRLSWKDLRKRYTSEGRYIGAGYHYDVVAPIPKHWTENYPKLCDMMQTEINRYNQEKKDELAARMEKKDISHPTSPSKSTQTTVDQNTHRRHGSTKRGRRSKMSRK